MGFIGGRAQRQQQQQPHRGERRRPPEEPAVFVGTDVKVLSGSLLKTTLGTKYRGDRVWIVVFHERSVSRVFAKAVADIAKSYVNVINVASVDCSHKDCVAFCEYNKVKLGASAVVLKLYSTHRVEDISASIRLGSRPQSLGRKQSRHMIKLAMERLPDQHIEVLGSKEEKESLTALLQFVKRCVKASPSKKACVVLASNKEQPSSLFKSISARHKLKLSFGFWHVRRSKHKDEMKRLGIKDLPTLLVYKVDASTKIGE